MLFIKSDELYEIEKNRLGKENFEKKMAELRKQNAAREAAMREQFESYKEGLTKSVENYVASELAEGVNA